jgi:hypothetical protein
MLIHWLLLYNDGGHCEVGRAIRGYMEVYTEGRCASHGLFHRLDKNGLFSKGLGRSSSEEVQRTACMSEGTRRKRSSRQKRDRAEERQSTKTPATQEVEWKMYG